MTPLLPSVYGVFGLGSCLDLYRVVQVSPVLSVADELGPGSVEYWAFESYVVPVGGGVSSLAFGRVCLPDLM